MDMPGRDVTESSMDAIDGGPATTTIVRHIVMWNVRGDTREERAASIALVREKFEGLRGRVPGLLSLEIGADISRISYACDIVLVTDFKDQDALSAYASDPLHLEVRDALTGIRTDRHQVDYPIAQRPI